MSALEWELARAELREEMLAFRYSQLVAEHDGTTTRLGIEYGCHFGWNERW
jgi:hypothetical protein